MKEFCTVYVGLGTPAAICEAASRPRMRFIPVKSVGQQSMLCVHRLREGLKEDRTACINRIRVSVVFQ